MSRKHTLLHSSSHRHTPAKHPLPFSSAHVLLLALFTSILPLSAGDQTTNPKPDAPSDQTQPFLTVETSVGIDSSYVSEGVDNIPDTEWLTATVDLSAAGFGFSALYGKTTGGNYDELNLGLSYTHEFGNLSITAGYTYLAYPQTDDPDGHEISLVLEYAVCDWLTIAANNYYDFADIDGGFSELTVSGNFPLVEDRISLNPYVLISYEYGYISRENDALNNAQVGIEIPISITDQLTLALSAHHSLALDNLRDENLGDVSWVGARLSFAF